ncbi:MAG: hypothetical protein GW855_04485 [Erythrobacter sp.]|nr:hypothetical protein [Erythrobacter sp.]NCQ62564.1 hypothetical protein [Alphaproteobacteria bacterium]
MLGLGASNGAAQDRFYERIGSWTVVGTESFCTAPGVPTPFPDGTMPPWESVTLYMSDPLTMQIRYSGRIAADAPIGVQEGQALVRSLNGKTDYFRPRMIVAEETGGSRLVTAFLKLGAFDGLAETDYFLLRAGDLMLPLALTPHRDELLVSMRRCVERL